MARLPSRPHTLLDFLIAEYGYKNDKGIAYALNYSAAEISRLRSRKHKPSSNLILAIYDATRMSIEEIRGLC